MLPMQDRLQIYTPSQLPKLGHPALEQILWRAANFPGEIVAASEELSFTADENAVATAIRYYLRPPPIRHVQLFEKYNGSQFGRPVKM